MPKKRGKNNNVEKLAIIFIPQYSRQNSMVNLCIIFILFMSKLKMHEGKVTPVHNDHNMKV
jgi:hypothetical protein